jgi:hypothetical protein
VGVPAAVGMHGGALLSTTEAAAVAVAVAAMDPRNAAGVRSGRQVMDFFQPVTRPSPLSLS